MPTFDTEQSKLNQLIDFASFSAILSNAYIPCCIAVYCAYDARGAIFLGRWIPAENFVYFPHGLIITLFHTYLVLIIAINQTLACIITFPNIIYMTLILSRELNLNLKLTQYRTDSSLRSAENLQHAYRSFQILTEQWNRVVGIVLWTGNLFFFAVPVLFMVMLLNIWQQLLPIARATLIMGLIIICVVWLILLQCGKYFWLQGNKTLRSWKLHGGKDGRKRRLMKKFHKSCRLILLRYGNALVLGRMNQFTYILGLIKWTCKVSLALNK